MANAAPHDISIFESGMVTGANAVLQSHAKSEGTSVLPGFDHDPGTNPQLVYEKGVLIPASRKFIPHVPECVMKAHQVPKNTYADLYKPHLRLHKSGCLELNITTESFS
jgi:hypothetical protein